MMNLPVPAVAPLLVGLIVVVALAVDVMFRLQRMRARRLPGAGTHATGHAAGRRPRRRAPLALLAPGVGSAGWPVAPAWQPTRVLTLAELEQTMQPAARPTFEVTAAPVGGSARPERANDSWFSSRFSGAEDSVLRSRYDSHFDSTLDSCWQQERAAADGRPVALATPRAGHSSVRQHAPSKRREVVARRLQARRGSGG